LEDHLLGDLPVAAAEHLMEHPEELAAAELEKMEEQ
jgi:hypothetical protein